MTRTDWKKSTKGKNEKQRMKINCQTDIRESLLSFFKENTSNRNDKPGPSERTDLTGEGFNWIRNGIRLRFAREFAIRS